MRHENIYQRLAEFKHSRERCAISVLLDSSTPCVWARRTLTCALRDRKRDEHPSGRAECAYGIFKKKIIITVTLFGRKASLANVEQVGEIGFGKHLSAALSVFAQRIHCNGIPHLGSRALILQVGLHQTAAASALPWCFKKKAILINRRSWDFASPLRCLCIYSPVSDVLGIRLAALKSRAIKRGKKTSKRK